jgi:glutathione peroxidase
MDSLLNIKFENFQGEEKTLNDFNSKLYLIVNVASKCGLTPQYTALEKVYNEFKDQGLMILGFPANEFLAQEPGTNEEIQSFCQVNYNVTFPILKKIVVKGEGQHPLYKTLTNTLTEATMDPSSKFLDMLQEKGLLSGEGHDIKWNFEKFLVSSEGKILKRFSPDIAPDHDLIIREIKSHIN